MLHEYSYTRCCAGKLRGRAKHPGEGSLSVHLRHRQASHWSRSSRSSRSSHPIPSHPTLVREHSRTSSVQICSPISALYRHHPVLAVSSNQDALYVHFCFSKDISPLRLTYHASQLSLFRNSQTWDYRRSIATSINVHPRHLIYFCMTRTTLYSVILHHFSSP